LIFTIYDFGFGFYFSHETCITVYGMGIWSKIITDRARAHAN